MRFRQKKEYFFYLQSHNDAYDLTIQWTVEVLEQSQMGRPHLATEHGTRYDVYFSHSKKIKRKAILGNTTQLKKVKKGVVQHKQKKARGVVYWEVQCSKKAKGLLCNTNKKNIRGMLYNTNKNKHNRMLICCMTEVEKKRRKNKYILCFFFPFF